MWTVIKSILWKLVELGLFLWKNKQQQIEDIANDVKSLSQAETDEELAAKHKTQLTKHEKESMEDLRKREKQLVEDSSNAERTDLVDLINHR